MKILPIALLCLGVLANTAAAQEGDILYVTDRLILNLYADRAQSGEALRSLPSGSRLEVISRDNRYAEVRTDDGQVGWVKSTFLVSEQPTRRRLEEAEEELRLLRETLETTNVGEIEQRNDALNTDLGAVRAELANTKEQVLDLGAQLEDASVKLADLSARNQEFEATAVEQQRFPDPPAGDLLAKAEHYVRSYPVWVGAAGGVMAFFLIIGLILGMWFAYRRQRKRLSGFRLA